MLKNIIFILSETYYKYIFTQQHILEKQVHSYGVALQITSTKAPTFPKATDTLFITDEPDFFTKLQTDGHYAIALYHEHNRNSSFPGALYAVEDIFQLEYRSYDEAYRRLANIPWDILETKRLLVRESTVDDISSFYKIYENPSITAYTEALYTDPLEETAYLQEYIRQVYGFYGFGIWTVLLKETNCIIGRAGLNVREGYDLPELGFVIDTAYQRQGLCFEVCRAILDYARDELDFSNVQAFVQENNIPSRKLLEKLGFTCQRQVLEKGQEYLLYICQLSFAYKKDV